MNEHKKFGKLLKRLLIVCLCLVMALGSAVTIIATSFDGDLNNDGQVTALDAQLLAEYEADLRDLDLTDKIGLTVKSIIDWILGRTESEPSLDEGVEVAFEVEAENGVVTEDKTVTADGVTATVAAGTKVTGKALKLSVKKTDSTEGEVALGENQEQLALDIHVDGVAADNTTPVVITVEQALDNGYNQGNLELYHVEDSVANEMEQVATAALNEHNSFYYDPATGDVTVAMATFSVVRIVSDIEQGWEGNYDYSWYENVVPKRSGSAIYEIANADQLAAFGAIVGGMDGQTQESFAGKTVKLTADINLGDKESENNPDIIFYPIGYNSDDGKYEKTGVAVSTGFYTFQGEFDGQGHTIANFYQNTWEMKGDHNWYDAALQYYRDGMGLFGKVYGGTIKNLTVDNFSSDGEIATTGVIAAYADGATFENIAITNCNPRVYNIGNGGIVGCVGWYAKEANLKTTFKNITVDNSNKISALWGSYDVACGGIVGQYYPTSGQSSAEYPVNGGIDLVNCHVAAQMDVYNDVCGNYQYYAYRYAGMLIGSIRENVTGDDGHVYPKMDGITASGCTVHYDSWNDYYYCEFEKNGHPSYAGENDYKFSRVPESELNFNADGTVTCKHEHSDVEDNRAIYLPFSQLFTGYGWGVTSKGIEDFEGVEVKHVDQKDSVEKFEGTGEKTVTANKPIKLNTLFAEKDGNTIAIEDANIQVAVTDLTEDDVNITAVLNKEGFENWKDYELTFTGTGDVQLTIQDYYFCTPTTIELTVEERQAEEKFETKFTGDFLYRVGNQNTVTLSSLFKAKDGAEIGTVSVTIEKIEGNATGTYTAGSLWDAGTIQFSNTGVVKVTIKDDDQYCEPTVLNLEVVDAKNHASQTAPSSLNRTGKKDPAYNIVLLNDVNVSSGATVTYENCVVYGNGFTFNARGGLAKYVASQGWGVINLDKDATLDNLVIVGDVYTTFGAYSDNDYNTAVVASLSGTIQNCHISNCATPVMVRGTTTIKDTTLYRGTVANLIIKSGTTTLENVTTVNYDDDRAITGMGIVIHSDASETVKMVINGTLTQHNFYSETDVPTDNNAKTLYDTMFDDSCSQYHFGTSPNRYVNTGIVSMVSTFDESDISGTWKETTEYKGNSVSAIGFDGYVYTQPNTVGEVNNEYNEVSDPHKGVQGDFLPTFTFSLGDQEISYDGDSDSRYLYGDESGVEALYQDGDAAISLDITKLATVTKYDQKLAVTAVCKDALGNALTATDGVVTLSSSGEYTLVFTVTDNIFYGADGQAITKSVTRIYTVPLSLSVKAADIKDAEVTISPTTLDGVYTTVNVTDYKLRIDFLNCISVTDYDSSGTGTKVNLTSNISSAELTPSGVNVFTTASTITVTYTDGRVLTVNLSKINGSSPGTKTAVVNTSGGLYFITDGALNNKPTEATSQNVCTITSVSFKGTNGATIKNDTDVTVTWELGSSSGTNPCFTSDTLITLADGSQKRADELSFEDKILAWDFFTGTYVEKNISLLVNHGEGIQRVINLQFSDGNTLRLIGEHGVFDYDLNKFVYITVDNMQDYVGHRFVQYKADGSYGVTTLNKAFETVETTCAYSVSSAVTSNAFASGMLTVAPPEDFYNWIEMGDKLQYNVEQFNADVEQYGLYTYDVFEDYVTYEQFVDWNGAYLKIPVEKGYFTFEYILELIELYKQWMPNY